MSAQPFEFAHLDKWIDDLRSEMHAGFVQIDQRFNDLRTEMRDGFARHDRKFDAIDHKVETIDHRLDTMTNKMEMQFRTLIGWMLGQTALVVSAILSVAFILKH